MLDEAEKVFHAIAQNLQEQRRTVAQTYGGEDMIHVLDEFEGE